MHGNAGSSQQKSYDAVSRNLLANPKNNSQNPKATYQNSVADNMPGNNRDSANTCSKTNANTRIHKAVKCILSHRDYSFKSMTALDDKPMHAHIRRMQLHIAIPPGPLLNVVGCILGLKLHMQDPHRSSGRCVLFYTSCSISSQLATFYTGGQLPCPQHLSLPDSPQQL